MLQPGLILAYSSHQTLIITSKPMYVDGLFQVYYINYQYVPPSYRNLRGSNIYSAIDNGNIYVPLDIEEDSPFYHHLYDTMRGLIIETPWSPPR